VGNYTYSRISGILKRDLRPPFGPKMTRDLANWDTLGFHSPSNNYALGGIRYSAIRIVSSRGTLLMDLRIFEDYE